MSNIKKAKELESNDKKDLDAIIQRRRELISGLTLEEKHEKKYGGPGIHLRVVAVEKYLDKYLEMGYLPIIDKDTKKEVTYRCPEMGKLQLMYCTEEDYKINSALRDEMADNRVNFIHHNDKTSINRSKALDQVNTIESERVDYKNKKILEKITE